MIIEKIEICAIILSIPFIYSLEVTKQLVIISMDQVLISMIYDT